MFELASYYAMGLFFLLVTIGWGASRCLLRHVRDRRIVMEWARRRGGRVVRSGVWHGLTVCFQARSQETCLWLLPVRCSRHSQLQLTFPWPTGERMLALRPTNAFSRIAMMYPRSNRQRWGRYQLYTQHFTWARKLLSGGASSSLRQVNALLNNRTCGLHLAHEKFTLRFRISLDTPNRLSQLIELGLDVGDQLGLQERGDIELSNQTESRRNNELYCPLCGGMLEQEIVYCFVCGTPHHLDCWRYVGRCSLFGCRETRYQQQRRKWLPWVVEWVTSRRQ
ncbi:MAG: hypothetical protein CMJ75_20900 [Planctomycetaceae bacterium]|nr:hypothetical protein [Planctomycetaceae bacterium]